MTSSRRRLRSRIGVTPRQIDIFSLVAEGRCDKEVASRLGLSVATVRAHLGSFYSATSLRNRVESCLRHSCTTVKLAVDPRDHCSTLVSQHVASMGLIDFPRQG